MIKPEPKNILKTKEDLGHAWEKIINKLKKIGEKERDFQTVSIHHSKETWFHASISNDVIFIQRPGNITKKSNLNKNGKHPNGYPIYKSQFTYVAQLYNDYTNEIHNEIRKDHMSSYTITLISNLL